MLWLFTGLALVTQAVTPAEPAEDTPLWVISRVPSAADIGQIYRTLSRWPHHAGSTGDENAAIYVRDRLRQAGLTATVEPFEGTVYVPEALKLELLMRPVVAFALREPRIALDSEEYFGDVALPFNSGSGNGDVRASAVYVNRGLPEDYLVLDRANVSVRGKIALIRYGAEFRGTLARRAFERGAAGIIFYSDPGDDGAARGAAYPRGRYRPWDSVQRGTVTTAGRQMRIPVLPVSAATARRLVSDIDGVSAPSGWTGGLGLPYRVGATRSLVHLYVRMRARRETLWNTIGTIRGRDLGQSVLVVAHRDAWVYGITDNGSGTAALLEAARALAKMHELGWVPQRTIRLVSFDAEEIGLLGSLEYVRSHPAELAGCVAVINEDNVASGATYRAHAVPALDRIASAVEPPAVVTAAITAPSGPGDYAPFLYGLGIPVLEAGFSGTLGVYHSLYDDYTYASRFADPGFAHDRIIAEVVARAVVALSDAPHVPYDIQPYIGVLSAQLDEIGDEARRKHLAFDPVALHRSVDRLAAAVDSPRREGPIGTVAAIRVVRLLNLTLYGTDRFESVMMPDLRLALRDGSQRELDLASKRTLERLGAAVAAYDATSLRRVTLSGH